MFIFWCQAFEIAGVETWFLGRTAVAGGGGGDRSEKGQNGIMIEPSLFIF